MCGIVLSSECLGDPFGECDAAQRDVDVGVAAVSGIDGALGETMSLQSVCDVRDCCSGNTQISGQIAEADPFVPVQVETSDGMQAAHGNLLDAQRLQEGVNLGQTGVRCRRHVERCRGGIDHVIHVCKAGWYGEFSITRVRRARELVTAEIKVY